MQCNLPPKKPAAIVRHVTKEVKQAPVKTSDVSINQNPTAQAASQNQTVTVVMPQQLPERIRIVEKPVFKYRLVNQVKPWTASILFGVAKTGYTLSGSSCNQDTCNGNLSRNFRFDAGLGINRQFVSGFSIGAIVTKESSMYITGGFSW